MAEMVDRGTTRDKAI